jgi:hypothetical protein
MNVMHRTGRESHELLLHAIADILLNPGRACLKHKVGKSLVGQAVRIPVASTFFCKCIKTLYSWSSFSMDKFILISIGRSW